ncbi:MAG: ABC transporter ATP-binding protein [Clostridia bacterium]|nr:ABC transporter ATP-binding protein [Clostridia bacterium]
MENTVLEIKNLQVSFRVSGKTGRAIRGVDLALKKGETLALVGESGSGKSVLTKTVMGLLPPNAKVEAGEVFYGGRDLTKLKEKELCRVRGSEIAMIFQDPFSSLNPIMRIGKQITETMRLREKGLSEREAKKRAIALMEEVGIDRAAERFSRYPFEFSGGMRQRIVIAIALAGNPKVLICDEPTTALDVSVQAQILELINRLKEERGLSVIFITHDLGVVAGVADTVAVMYAGKIVEYGGLEEIFFEPKHPYTWALLSSVPDLDTKGELNAIEGVPPDIFSELTGDAFAPRNPYAMKIDFEKEPPFFKVSDTHYAATWLMHEFAPKTAMPKELKSRITRMKRTEKGK